jgi:putative ABC transport system substrate-binding protein
MPVIGFLGAASPATYPGPLEAFHQGLRDQGYIEGRNVAITYQWALGDTEKLPALAAELVRMGVDVIVASGGASPVLAAEAATRTIPIVSTGAGGAFASSFARPGGNITGAHSQGAILNPKRLELLHQAVPGAALVAVLSNPATVDSAEALNELREAGRSLGVRLYMAEARGEADFDEAFALIAQAGAGAVLVIGGPSFLTQSRKIVTLAARYKLRRSTVGANMPRTAALWPTATASPPCTTAPANMPAGS